MQRYNKHINNMMQNNTFILIAFFIKNYFYFGSLFLPEKEDRKRAINIKFRNPTIDLLK